jgi:hypothetical protein
MSWTNLGIVKLEEDWKLFNRPTNATTFRFTALGFSSIPPYLRGFAWIQCQLIGMPTGEGGSIAYKKVWANPQPTIIELPRLKDLERAGYYSQVISAKQGKARYNKTPFPWSLQLEEFELPMTEFASPILFSLPEATEVAIPGNVLIAQLEITIIMPLTDGYIGVFAPNGDAVWEIRSGLNESGRTFTKSVNLISNYQSLYVTVYSASTATVQFVALGYSN